MFHVNCSYGAKWPFLKKKNQKHGRSKTERRDAEQHSPVRDRSFWGWIINQHSLNGFCLKGLPSSPPWVKSAGAVFSFWFCIWNTSYHVDETDLYWASKAHNYIYPLLELWYFNIQLVKLLSILATKHLFCLLYLCYFCGGKRLRKKPPCLLAAAESGNWTYQDFYLQQLKNAVFELLLRDSETSPRNQFLSFILSLHRFPCAIREDRRVKKTRFTTKHGMNFSSERGILLLEA